MRRASIRTAILFPSLAVLIAGITVMAFVVSYFSSKAAKGITNQLIEASVDEQTNEFRAYCVDVYSALQATAPVIADYASGGATAVELSDPRGAVTDILSKVLLGSSEMVAIWTCWEPGRFDGRDSDYANTSFYDNTGRFVPYVYKSGGGTAIDALSDYEDPVAGEYYQGARGSGKPYMTDPYLYNMGGTETLICSIAIPILKDGVAIGVVGADIGLSEFIALMNNADILEDGYVYVLSPGGLVTTHPNNDIIMKRYDTTWMKECAVQTENALKNGGGFGFETYSDVIHSRMSLMTSAVMIGDTGRYWLVCGVVPEKTVNASSASLLQMTILIGLVLTLLVGSTIFLIVQSNLKSLPRLRATAEAIAIGSLELSAEETDSGETKNEITLLDRAFGQMVSAIREQAEVLTRISQGDYSMSVLVRSEGDTMNIALNQMLESSNGMLNEINTIAEQVSLGSKQIADGAQSLAQGTTEQASSVEHLSASVSEIADKTKQNEKIAEEAAVLSGIIKESAEKGSEKMAHMMTAVREINEASSRIEKVIQSIDDIAFQTNILALNAAVEAARAGSAGKGFAVVAEEVRSLAAKSAESAKNTSVMIENSIRKANIGLTIATDTSESLNEIVDGINRSVEIVAQIARSSSEQSRSILEINTGMEQISAVVQLNSATAEQSAAASEELSGQSESLTRQTSQFRLK